MSYLMDGPNYLSSVPEDHSFELDPTTFNEVHELTTVPSLRKLLPSY